jgi:uncharacterized membrane protein YagU involved in acid resistance
MSASATLLASVVASPWLAEPALAPERMLDLPTLLYSLIATALLTTLLTAGQGLGWTRMSMPFLIGSALTPKRNMASVLGFAIHFVNGWLFALLYVLTFDAFGLGGWWQGAALGLFHGLFVLVVLMPLLPSLHPRMASEDYGPSPTRQLEPPGFLALHYGRFTPILTLLGHVLFGAVLGTCHVYVGH